MAFLNTKTVDKNVGGGFELLPKGVYRVVVSKLEEKTSRAGGSYISAQFDVIEGPFKGRKLWHNFTTKHSNDTAVAIGQAHLAKLIEACGFEGEVRDEKHFYSICMDAVLRLEVGVKKDKQTGEDRQQVFDFAADAPAAGATTADDFVPPF